MLKVEWSGLIPTEALRKSYFDDLVDYWLIEPIENAEYKSLMREKTGWKLLDNGFHEYKRPVSSALLRKWVDEVNANAIVAPDMLGNWDFNYQCAISCRSDVMPYNVEVFGVLGGGLNHEWQDQADTFSLEPPAINGICLPFKLNRFPILTHSHVHLFGFKHPEDYWSYRQMGYKRLTIDTVEPISAALRGILYEAEGGIVTYPRVPDYMNWEFTLDTVTIARSNIMYLKEHLNRRPPWLSTDPA